MNALLGTLFLATAAVLFAWGYSQFRRPEPKHWTVVEVSSQIVTLVFVVLLTFGLGFLIRYALAPDQEPLRWTDAAAMAAILAVAVVAIRACRAGLRRAREDRSRVERTALRIAVTGAPSPANDPGRDSPSPPLSSGARGRGRHGKAA